MSPQLIILFIAMAIGLQPIATDLYLPALPDLTAGLGTTTAQAQLTLTALLLPFGISQLAWGPLSDRFGRRPILLAGLVLFSVGAIGCVFAQSITTLQAWRALEGIGMGATVMTGRAVVRDAFAPSEGARVMSKALAGLGVLSCLGPVVGGFLAEYAGWRWTLGSIAVFSCTLTLVVFLWFRETLPAERQSLLDVSTVAQHWRTVLRHPTFIACSLLMAMTYSGFVIFLITTPFVFIQVLGLSRVQFGLAILSNSFFFIVGTILCRWLLAHRGLRTTVATGGALSLASGLLLAGQAWTNSASIWTLVPAVWVYALGHGIHLACSQSGAVAPFPRMAGVASALNGCISMAVAFLVGGLVGKQLEVSVSVMAYGVLLCCIPLALVAWTLMQRHGELKPA